LVTSGLLWSPTLRSHLGFERAASQPVAQPAVHRATILKTVPAETKEGAQDHVDSGTISRPEPRSLPVAKKTDPASGDPGGPKLQVSSPQPVTQVQHGPDPPMPLAFTLPDVPTSLLGSRDRQSEEIRLTEEVGDRFEILNAPELQVVPASTKSTSTWEIATRTKSLIGGGFTLASLSHIEATTWSFDWTKVAKNHSATVAALRDAVLRFETRDGRSILALLRGVRRHDPEPLLIWENQPVLYERLDDRHKSIPWTPHPEDLAGTHWRLSIRRWRLLIERPGAEGREPVRRVIEPASAVVGNKKDGNGRVPLEQDLMPGVVFKVGIDTENPEMIAVRVVPDRNQVLAGRADRAARLKELKASTPADRQGREQDPIPFRRSRLEELQQSGSQHEDEVKTLKKEISDLEAIHAIGQVEDLLTNPARTQLSVVISLDVAGSAPLDVARIGEFSENRKSRP
jgi:hypothetical protein